MGRQLPRHKPQPPRGQADTPTCSPSAARSRPASASSWPDRTRAGGPRQSKGKLSQLGVCRRKGQREGEPRGGREHVLVEGSPEWQAGLCSGPQGARRRHPPSIAAGLKGKHKDQFGNGSVSLAQEKGREEGERLGGGAGRTGKGCENG